MESLRIDDATIVGGLRVNTWMSLVIMVVSVAVIVRGGVLRSDEERAAALAVAPWVPPVDGGDGAAASAGPQLAEDDVAEGGPQDPGPGPEVGVAEPDEGELRVRVDPDEGA